MQEATNGSFERKGNHPLKFLYSPMLEASLHFKWMKDLTLKSELIKLSESSSLKDKKTKSRQNFRPQSPLKVIRK